MSHSHCPLQTQPVPNPCAYLLHHAPQTVHALETAGNHVVELLVPWLVLGNRACRLACAAVQILFQVPDYILLHVASYFIPLANKGGITFSVKFYKLFRIAINLLLI